MIKVVDSIRYFLYNVGTTKELTNLIKHPPTLAMLRRASGKAGPTRGK